MILRHHDVEAPLSGLHEDGVARPGAACVDALGACPFNGRLDDIDFLAPELAALARVRVEARDSHAGMLDPVAPGTLVREPDGRQLAFDRYEVDRVAQCHMDGDEDDAQLVIREHHRDLIRAGEIREHLGVARTGDAGQRQRFLVDRRGDDGGDVACVGEVDGVADIGIGRGARGGAEPARGYIGQRLGRRDDVDDTGCLRRIARRFDHADIKIEAQSAGGRGQGSRIADHDRADRKVVPGEKLQRNFWPDAGGIAHRNRNTRKCAFC